MRFVRHDSADPALRHHLLHGREVPRVTPVLVYSDDAPLLLGELDQLCGFRERECKRLIDDDVMTGPQAMLGDRMMRGIGCGHDDEIERPGPQLVDTAN